MHNKTRQFKISGPAAERGRRILIRTSAFALIIAIGASGCECDQPPVTRFDPETQIDEFGQDAQAKVDILWVVDNSDSMFAEQRKISNGFSQFFGTLIESEVDYHIGVITTDPDDQGRLRSYDGPQVPGCNGCTYLSNQVACDDPTVQVQGSSPEDAEAELFEKCHAQLVFRNLVAPGVNGSPFEEGFNQAALALGAGVIDSETGYPTGDRPEENDGFIRDDAGLYIIFVSDEDEGAKEDGAPIRYYQRLFENIKGQGDEQKVSVSAIVGWPLEDQYPAIADVCPILETTYDNRQETNHPKAADVLEALATDTGCEDRPAPGEDPVTNAETGSRYIDLACRTGGVITNMCDSDYSEALDALGANAAGLRRKWVLSRFDEISKGQDCTLFTADDKILDCNEDGDTTDEGIDLAICVKGVPLGGGGQEFLVPRSEINGWTYEQATGSLNFRGRFLPAPGTSVTVSYKIKLANDPEECRE